MTRESTRISKRKWPCGTFACQCINDAVYCESCFSWYHATCENLSVTDLKVLQKLPQDYLCSSCVKDGNRFDSARALQQLETANRVGKLESALKMEQLRLRNAASVQARSEELLFRSNHTIDNVAQSIQKKFSDGEYYLKLSIYISYVDFKYIVL